MNPPILSTLALSLLSGAAWAQAPQLISRSVLPTPARRTGNGASTDATLSGNGRYVVFVSGASDLVKNDSNGTHLDTFRRAVTNAAIQWVSDFGTGGALSPLDSFAPSVSRDGALVSFQSSTPAPNVSDGNGVSDVFVRRMDHPTAEVISLRPDNTATGNGASGPAAISSDGRFVAFESLASNLVAGADTNGVVDLFLRDLATGTTRLLSHAAGTANSGDGPSWDPQWSRDGQTLLFRSQASNLTSTAGNLTDLHVWNRTNDTLQRIVLPGEPLPAARLPVRGVNPVLSDDGRYLAFRVGSRLPVDPHYDGVWYFDLVTGHQIKVTDEAASLASTGSDDTSGPVMSGDGRTLAFEQSAGSAATLTLRTRLWSEATGLRSLGELPMGAFNALAEPTNSRAPVLNADGSKLLFVSQGALSGTVISNSSPYSLHLRDLKSGETRALPTATHAGAGELPYAELSADESLVLFQTEEELLTDTPDTNRASDVFAWQLASDTVLPVSVADTNSASIAASASVMLSSRGVSADGSRVLLASTATNLVPGKQSLWRDVYLADRIAGTNSLISHGLAGAEANGGSTPLALSADGQRILFTSLATNLITGDTNQSEDIFLADRPSGTIQLINARDASDAVSTGSLIGTPAMSLDGQWVAFISTARDLIPTPVQFGNNLYLRDVAQKRTRWVNNGALVASAAGTLGSPQRFALSESGEAVAFTASPVGLGDAYVYRRSLNSTYRASTNLTVQSLAIFDAGPSLAFVGRSPDSSSTSLYFVDLSTSTTRELLRLPTAGSIRSLQIAGEGRVVIFVTASALPSTLTGVIDDNNVSDVFYHDVSTGITRLASVSPDGSLSRQEASDPSVSVDGRLITFRSLPIITSDSELPSFAQIRTHDTHTGKTALVSAGNAATTGATRSADGRVIAFASAASDLAAGDGNALPDVFTFTIPEISLTDSDHDGLPDEWESHYFGNLNQNGSGDLDQDGQTNAEEYLAGTDPTRSSSVFRVAISRGTGQEAFIQWLSVPGVSYSYERASDLAPGSFAQLIPPINGDGTVKTLPISTSVGMGWIRISAYR